MKKLLTKFEAYIKSKDGRFTTQKSDVATAIFKTDGTFEVEQFISRLNQKKTQFSRATVYRTIKELLDANLIQQIPTKDGKVYYEKVVENQQNDHIICSTCGQIIAIENQDINTLLNTLCSKLNFAPEYRSLHIYGECQIPNCKGR